MASSFANDAPVHYQSSGCEDAMRPRHVFLLLSTLSNCVTAKYPAITSETKVELPPYLISCKLNDIVILTAPSVNEKKPRYYLTKPNGDVIKLPEFQSKLHKVNDTIIDNEAIINDTIINAAIINDTFINNDTFKPKYRVFNVNNPKLRTDVFNDNAKKMGAMEFMLGPLGEDDHGNWVLSVYTNLNGEVIELFQVISIEIIESVPIEPKFPKINEGSTFKLQFAYPIKHLESCELLVPMSTSDRAFDRGEDVLNSCGFVVRNITKKDQGWWKIIGLGKIVYIGKVYLKVNKNI